MTTSLIPVGFCQCGCGRRTGLSSKRRSNRGTMKGVPSRFARGHTSRTRHDQGGADKKPRRPWIIAAERALGHPLPPGAQVHHLNGNRADNASANLVVCEDQAYHGLLHARQRALRECGNPDWRRCMVCGKWDATERLLVCGESLVHRQCKRVREAAAYYRRLLAKGIVRRGTERALSAMAALRPEIQDSPKAGGDDAA